jgi:hypothetical protein
MLRQYEITADVLCHDIKLNTSLRALVSAEQPPSKVEAEHHIFQLAEQEYATPTGCWFEVSNLKVKPIES